MRLVCGKLCDALLDKEILDTMVEARILLTDWKRENNAGMPHSTLGYRPPAPEATVILQIGKDQKQ